MSVVDAMITRAARETGIGLLVMALVLAWHCTAEAQVFSNQRAVGGVFVDPAGMLSNADVAARGELQQAIAAALDAVPDGLGQPVPVRKVSLKGLESAIRKCAESGEQLPDSVLYLGGLQQIEYVLVYPEENDIVLAGPGEGWKVNAQGAVVGVTTGRPVMLLDDLLVALRSASAPPPSVISCSIDPTPEGLRRVQSHAARLKANGNPQAAALSIEQQLGPQKISVTGVPGTSHFARVMVAADYRMKRVSMNLEPSPVPGLKSFLTMIRSSSSGVRSMLPRWWLAPDYQPLLRDADGLAWQLRGAAVKTMAENDFLDAAGVKHRTGKADAVSQRWADNMTEHYEELSVADPVFGQLRNCMDLAIASTLIVRQSLLARAGLELPMLMGSDGLPTARLNTPQHIPSKASLMYKGRWMVACGGVQINPWEIVEHVEQSDTLAGFRSEAALNDSSQWWSN